MIICKDDSIMNRKIMTKIIKSVECGRFKDTELLEADDGSTAIELLHEEISANRRVDFILMDFVMVQSLIVIMLLFQFCYLVKSKRAGSS